MNLIFMRHGEATDNVNSLIFDKEKMYIKKGIKEITRYKYIYILNER